ncbi:permease component of ABC-type sugar transporter [Halobacteroides halobius DSM 5150]|uniref:Permease component of ABC-type sugar transporter n=1 Tax=Halobacteroides halobius (strain ATCC 35273 / DSM 5150 / MD-1) TaxID=748449 RepID=L0K8X7_HALHC|nr:sugar ABC transporter permease [Halobacteroides halobius]AGB41742.1 permease component of ABC-type sugar transporter [Halobacteroides halobius DSM 5150]
MPKPSTKTGFVSKVKNIFNLDKEDIISYLFITPAMLLISIFILIPILFNVMLSFTKWNIISPMEFVGLKNYIEMFQSPSFWNAFANTGYFVAMAVPLTVACSLFLAILLNQKIKGLGFFRTAFFSPQVISFVAAGLVWVWMLDDNKGLVNYLLGMIGVEPINWLQSTTWAMPAVILLTVWRFAGYFMVVYLAGLQGIPKTYYEAASLDGAGSGWKAFRHITWPLLKPTTLFVTIMMLFFSFRGFAQFHAMTKGGPMGSTTVLVYHMYELAFDKFNMGEASAVAVVLLVISMIVSRIQINLLGDEE